MNPLRFSQDARRLLALAHQAAVESGARAVEQEHLALACLRDPATGLVAALNEIGASPDTLRDALAQTIGSRPLGATGAIVEPSPAFEAFLHSAWEAARAQQRHHVVAIDLIEALLAEGSTQTARAKLLELGGKQQDFQRAITALKNRGSTKDSTPKARSLRKFSRCLTDLAADGLLDPVIGRDQEIRRVMQVLSRRLKNNPVLIGKPGVGKTSIVEGLAERIVRGEVPHQLKNTSIFALDLGALAGGSDFRGAFEERMRSAMEDIREARGSIILFIDELQVIAKAGGEIAGVLKPALISGELRCIGVTTLDDYRTHIEKDGALERRFQAVRVEEPNVDQTVSILRGLKSRYEAHHDIRIDDSALVAAAALSHRFVSDRSLPDKAIDLVDEAASKVRIEADSLPVDVEATGRLAAQLALEVRDLEAQRGNDNAPVRRMSEQIAELAESATRDQGAWKAQKALVDAIRSGRASAGWRAMVLAFATELGWSQTAVRKANDALHALESRVAEEETHLDEMQTRDGRICKLDLDDEDIAHVVAAWTGIPIRKLVEDEKLKLLNMEDRIQERIVGQPRAVRTVANAVRLARAGMKDPNRPVGSFLFLGPTGVGKTELSRALAEFLFDDEQAMVRIDMSEYMEKHTVSRLVGAPPGYIGYEDSGQLTEAVRRKPYSVVLFDEIEKAHPDIFNILLQIMDDGRLTDGHGRTVDFKNTILIMTSNVGGHLYRENLETPKARLDEMLNEELRSHFRPEFLNRIDAIVKFDMLRLEQIKQIVEIQTRLVNRRLAPGGIRLEITEPVKAYLAERGFDILLGARPLKRLIQSEVLEPLALQVLQGNYRDGDVVVLSMREGKAKELVFTRRRSAATQPKRRRRDSNGAGSADDAATASQETVVGTTPAGG